MVAGRWLRKAAKGDLDFARLDPVWRGFIDAWLGLYGFDAKAFCRPIAAADEMFFNGILLSYERQEGIAAFKYVESCLRLFDAFAQIGQGVFGGVDQVGSVLDFASGYGRLTRALAQKLPRERLWVSDIYREAIAWQAATFGVNAFASAGSPDLVRHDRSHDVVWVGSMFSHLPAPLFHAWLAKLYSFVAPGGVLAFSVHDESLLPDGETMDASGLSFFRASESSTLDLDIYGMSYVTERFVGDAIARLGGRPQWRCFPKGLYENQDLYVVAGPGAKLDRLMVASTPMGGLESASLLTNGAVEFSGWAIERTPGQAITQIRVHVEGQPIGCARPTQERPDVLAQFPGAANTPVGWRFRLSPEQARPGATLRLQLESGSGLTGQVFAKMPAAATMTYSGWSRRGVPFAPSGLE